MLMYNKFTLCALLNLVDLQEIQQTLHILSSTLAGSFSLGWTHCVALLTISDADERRFYEIEARENSWGARELKKQLEEAAGIEHQDNCNQGGKNDVRKNSKALY